MMHFSTQRYQSPGQVTLELTCMKTKHHTQVMQVGKLTKWDDTQPTIPRYQRCDQCDFFLSLVVWTTISQSKEIYHTQNLLQLQVTSQYALHYTNYRYQSHELRVMYAQYHTQNLLGNIICFIVGFDFDLGYIGRLT